MSAIDFVLILAVDVIRFNFLLELLFEDIYRKIAVGKVLFCPKSCLHHLVLPDSISLHSESISALFGLNFAVNIIMSKDIKLPLMSLNILIQRQ